MSEKADVIIILGGGINKDGSLKSPSLFRVKLAAELYHQGLADYIMPSSKWSFQLEFIPSKTIAAAMREVLIKQKIPASNIIIEDASYDTIGNIYFCKKLLKNHHWKNIMVVTSPFHEKRAKYLCKKILGSDYQVNFAIAENGLSNDELKIQIELEEKLLSETKIYFNLICDGDDNAIQKLIEKHPAYCQLGKNFNFLNTNIRSPFHK